MRHLALSLAIMLAAFGCGDGGDDSNDFFAGKTIEITTGSSAGGGSDTAIRLLASYFEEHVEGAPSVQVVNVTGGGGVLAGNQFSTMEANGLNLLMLSASATFPAILGGEEVDYRFEDMIPLWMGPAGRLAYYSPDSGITTIEDLLDPPADRIITGSTHPASTDVFVFAAWEAAGLLDSHEIVFGYESSGAVRSAFQAGEIQMNTHAPATFLREEMHLVEQGDANIVYTFGSPDGEGGLMRDPLFPDVPHIGEVYELLRGEAPSGEAWDAFMTLFSNAGFSLWTHKDSPPEAVEALHEGIAKILEDPEYAEASEETMPYAQITGENVMAWGEDIRSLDPESVQWLRDFLTEEFDVEF